MLKWGQSSFKSYLLSSGRQTLTFFTVFASFNKPNQASINLRSNLQINGLRKQFAAALMKITHTYLTSHLCLSPSFSSVLPCGKHTYSMDGRVKRLRITSCVNSLSGSECYSECYWVLQLPLRRPHIHSDVDALVYDTNRQTEVTPWNTNTHACAHTLTQASHNWVLL